MEDPSRPPASDWTDNIPLGDHIRFFKTTNWAASLLGSLETWSTALRLYTYQMLSDSRPAVIYWGPEKVAIYNEAFVPLAGKAHPALMGSRLVDIFPEIWSDIKPIFDAVATTFKAVDVVELPLLVERSGFLEETFFTGNFNPLRGDNGLVEGFYNALSETTRQKLSDRRTEMLMSIAALPLEYNWRAIGHHIIKSLATNAVDIPFALLYQHEVESTEPASASGLLTLRGSIGVPKGHSLHVQQGPLESDEGLFPLLRKTKWDPVTLPLSTDFDGIEWAGYGEPSKHICIVPLANTGRLLGYLVVGTNPRRPIDADHHRLMQDLASKISSGIALAQSTEKVALSEAHIRYMAEHLDVALEHLTTEGKILWANESFYKLINSDPSPELLQSTLPFKNNVYEEDQPKIFEAWKEVVTGVKAQTIELRMKRLFYPPIGPPVPATVLLSAFPYREDGAITSIMACMTDVSRLKWAEAWQARAARDAQEAKRQQSEFTDAISHEVRNPLSAIFQLADDISSSLDNLEQQASMSVEACMKVLRQNIESAKTILVCAKHQKRLVDDVLTLSKLDFNSVKLVPTPVSPTDLVNGVLKILDMDLAGAGITFRIQPHQSIKSLAVEWVLCDPLRITQILINLLSNAIKFTKDEKTRQITLAYGCSLSEPKSLFPDNILWVSPKREHQDATLGEEWGNGEQLYLTFMVNDTGPGITDEDCRHLFNKFQQASPKTSVRYGGTGLGLFISQTLVEKQCGSIGLFSEYGKGSTFAFYVKIRRSSISSDTLPESIAAVDLGDAAKDILKPAVVLPKSPAARRPQPSGCYHILLVEDNLVNQRVLRKQLTRANCTVYVANHGLEALEVLRTANIWKDNAETGIKIDVVLMDLEMPVLNGLAATREIRSLEANGDLTRRSKIIAVTANVRQEQVERAMAAGVDGVMPKPFLIADLLITIKKMLGT